MPSGERKERRTSVKKKTNKKPLNAHDSVHSYRIFSVKHGGFSTCGERPKYTRFGKTWCRLCDVKRHIEALVFSGTRVEAGATSEKDVAKVKRFLKDLYIVTTRHWVPDYAIDDKFVTWETYATSSEAFSLWERMPRT